MAGEEKKKVVKAECRHCHNQAETADEIEHKEDCPLYMPNASFLKQTRDPGVGKRNLGTGKLFEG